MLDPITAGEDVTADRLTNAYDDTLTTKYQSTDQSSGVSNTTPVSSTFLVAPMLASTVYKLRAQLFYDANTTADFKVVHSVPAGATLRLSDPNGTSSTSATRTYQGAGAGTVSSADYSGHIVNDTAAGDLTITFAQNTSNATNASLLKTGSTIELIRLT